MILVPAMLVISLSTSKVVIAPGSFTHLCQQVHAKFSQSVVAEIYDGDEKLPEIKFDGTVKDLSRQLYSKSDYTAEDVEGVIAIKPTHVSPRIVNPRGQIGTDQIAESVHRMTFAHPINGRLLNYKMVDLASRPPTERVTVEMAEREATNCNALAAMRLKKPLLTTWIYRNNNIVLEVKNCSESAMARALAAAVGGKYFSNRDSEVIGFEPKEYRRRMITAFNDPLRSFRGTTPLAREYYKTRNEFLVEGLKVIPDAVLVATSQSISSRNGDVPIVKGSRIWAVGLRLMSLTASFAETPEAAKDYGQGLAAEAQGCSPDAEMQIFYQAPISVSLGVKCGNDIWHTL